MTETTTASLSHVGRVRTANQDVCGEFANADGYRLLVVADGMGGHAGGETASRMALEAIGDVFGAGFENPSEMLRKAIQTANATIHEMGMQDPDLHNMGTTAALLLLGPGASALVAHVGDSRVYRVRSGEIEQITDDHSWVSEEVRQSRLTPQQAETHPMKNVLLRSIGVAPEVDASITPHQVRKGDRFVICSDGLWGEVDATDIKAIVARANADVAVRELVELANKNGGSDNVTVQVAIVMETSGATTEDVSIDEPTLSDETLETPQNTDSITLPVETLPEEQTLPVSVAETGSSWTPSAVAFMAGLAAVLALWRACT